jgi:hypothetical protein
MGFGPSVRIRFRATPHGEGDSKELLSAIARAAQQQEFEVESSKSDHATRVVEFTNLCFGDPEDMIAAVTKAAEELGYEVVQIATQGEDGRWHKGESETQATA